jgi:hypothetical protein
MMFPAALLYVQPYVVSYCPKSATQAEYAFGIPTPTTYKITCLDGHHNTKALILGDLPSRITGVCKILSYSDDGKIRTIVMGSLPSGTNASIICNTNLDSAIIGSENIHGH